MENTYSLAVARRWTLTLAVVGWALSGCTGSTWEQDEENTGQPQGTLQAASTTASGSLAIGRSGFTATPLLDINGEAAPVPIRRPPRPVITALFKAAREAGEIDSENSPVDEDGAVRFLARIVRACLFLPGAVRPLYGSSPEEFACTEAVSLAGKQLEAIKGN